MVCEKTNDSCQEGIGGGIEREREKEKEITVKLLDRLRAL